MKKGETELKYTPPSASGDDPRHKNWCEHFRKSDKTCWCKDSPYFGIRCLGAAHCEYYRLTEGSPALIDEQSEASSADVDVIVFPTNLVGKTVRHRMFGIGTITNVSDQIVTIRFEAAGTKRFMLDWCVRNGMLQPQDFTYVRATNLAELLIFAEPKAADGSPAQENDWTPSDPPPHREIAPEQMAEMRAYVNRFTEDYEESNDFFPVVCADAALSSDRFNECECRRVHRDLAEPVARSLRASPPIPRPKPSFQKQFLTELIKREMTTVECYTRANVDRKLFSKIMTHEGYVPRKEIALALILTLRPSPCERDELLRSLGYSLSESNEYDLIVRYCSEHGIFNIDEINGYLYKTNPKWKLLGSCCE